MKFIIGYAHIGDILLAIKSTRISPIFTAVTLHLLIASTGKNNIASPCGTLWI
jgi:hypothetical protein